MDGSKLIYLLLICQGFYLGSVCQEWTFPSRITVLIGSCMKIPCIYHLAWCSGASSMEYKVQTTLMPGNNSCTPRIDPERSDDYDEFSYEYYPRKKNRNKEDKRKLNDKNKQPKRPNLDVRDAAIGVHIIVKKEHEFSELICDFLSSRPDVTHYTWMKDGSILHNEMEKTLTIHSNEENYGQYSCIAHNSAGNSSSEEINIQAEDYKYTILLATSGTICLLMLVLLLYVCWRKRQKKLTSAETEATYTDLRRSDITSTYDQLQPVTPADTTAVGSDVGASNEYENIHKLHFLKRQ